MMQQVATGPTYLEIVARNSDQTSYVIPFWLFPFILVPELLFASSSIAASVALSPRVTLRQRQRSSFGRLVGQSVGRFGRSVGRSKYDEHLSVLAPAGRGRRPLLRREQMVWIEHTPNNCLILHLESSSFRQTFLPCRRARPGRWTMKLK